LNGKIHKEKKENNLINFESKSESKMDEKKDISFQLNEFDDIEYEFDDIEKENKDNKFMEMKNKKKIRIKLVIAEICKNSTQKAFRKLLSPVLTTFDTQQQFGMFHSALIVGPWYLECNNCT
jgi:hypothetical protein